jgi:vacuolar protein sorting-associated protein 26A/B
MNFLKSLVGPAATVAIGLDGLEDRPHHNPKAKKKPREPQAGEVTDSSLSQDRGPSEGLIPIFYDNETLSGTVSVALPEGKTLEHMGIKVILHGAIKSTSGSVHDFLQIEKELEPAGTLSETKNYTFAFEGAERKYESYRGVNISLSYFVRVHIQRSMATNISQQQEIWVNNYQSSPEHNSNIRMEVGIEDCLHIEFEYNKSKYHLKDVIIGKIFFLLVRLKIKSMNISLIRRETTGSGLDMYNENRTLSKFEVMDGCPVKGEAIPVRIFLGSFDITPSYKDVANKFSVSYILNLVLVDEDDRRYFKQREIVLWRRTPQAKGDEFAITSVEGRTELPAEYKARLKREKDAKRARKEKRAQRRAEKEKARKESDEPAAEEDNGDEEPAAGGEDANGDGE